MRKLSIILAFFLIGCSIKDQKNTMSLDELLTKERNQYLETFQLGLEKYKTAKSAIEIMIQTKADQNRMLPELYQINRYDLINIDAEGKYGLTEFNLEKDSVLDFAPQVYEIDGMKIIVSPFVWNGCELTTDKKPIRSFDNWAKRWMDIDEVKKPTADGYLNVIHSVTYPAEQNSKWTTSIDFGSSPIVAFKELLTTLSGQGIKTVEVHSKTFLE
ncbi:MAG: hypothetical protein EOO07_19445 [Chitinophagaceae bacterium]|nr:MAG: hypothetical protein EOO07_19445 [Chitinophagaceae bacterium]